MKKSFTMTAVILSVILVLTGCMNGNQENTAAESAQKKNTADTNLNMPWIASKNTTRINTDDPATAATLISQSLWMATEDENRPGSVILTDPENWQNAVVSADLIHHPSNGPILFINKDKVSQVTLKEIQRLKPKGTESNNGVQAILVGDFAEGVQKQIKDLGLKTDTITGENPPALAQAIDAYYAKVAGENPMSVIIGSMDSQEYTIPAINWISHMPEPLLYVEKNQIPQETVDALKTRKGKANIYILGPESVISKDVATQLNQYGKVARIAGDDPYANAVAFAQYKDTATGFGWGITTPGHNFSFVNLDTPELAIAGAPFSHLGKHAPLLWTRKDRMPDSVMSYVMSVQPKYEKSPTEGPYNHSWLIGSQTSISAVAQGHIDTMLEIVSASGMDHGSMGGMNGNTGSNDSMEETDTKEVPNNSSDMDMGDMPGMNH